VWRCQGLINISVAVLTLQLAFTASSATTRQATAAAIKHLPQWLLWQLHKRRLPNDAFPICAHVPSLPTRSTSMVTAAILACATAGAPAPAPAIAVNPQAIQERVDWPATTIHVATTPFHCFRIMVACIAPPVLIALIFVSAFALGAGD
jgi:hypothetical protein